MSEILKTFSAIVAGAIMLIIIYCDFKKMPFNHYLAFWAIVNLIMAYR